MKNQNKKSILINARDSYKMGRCHTLVPTLGGVLPPLQMLAAIELTRHVPCGVTPAEFFSSYPIEEQLECYEKAISAS